MQNLNLLETNSLVKMDDGFILQPTGMDSILSYSLAKNGYIFLCKFSEIGRLMARYCVAFESMKRFLGLKGNETLSDLVSTYRHTHNHDNLAMYMYVRSH